MTGKYILQWLQLPPFPPTAYWKMERYIKELYPKKDLQLLPWILYSRQKKCEMNLKQF